MRQSCQFVYHKDIVVVHRELAVTDQRAAVGVYRGRVQLRRVDTGRC